jgi:hypothetical protein
MKRTAAFLYRYPFLMFLLFLFAAYLPVFLPFFHLKNDLITQNLPTRYVISEGLYSGYFPWWNPYIHYGIPQYGDMNNGFWNPVLWVIAKTVGYSVYTITWEEMFYLLIGGWGMYKLIKDLFTKDVALLTGLAYMCCGYAIGHLQHFIWITGVAFFPYVLLFFLRVNKNPVIKNFIGGGISVFFFAASTHPGLIIGAAYFFLFAIVFIYLFRKTVAKEYCSTKFWLINFLFLVFACVCSLVVIVSNLEVIQHISRGNKVSLGEALLHPTTLQSYLSLVFPLAVHKSDFFNTDISMRNVFGGIGLIAGLFFYFKNTNRRIILYSLIPFLFFILLASGGWFKTFAWKVLPFTGFVRLNGEFTYFSLLILFLMAAAGLDSLLKQRNYKTNASKFCNWFILFFVGTAVVSLILIFITKSSVIFSGINGGGKVFIKSVIDNLSFTDLFFIQSLVMAISAWLIKKFISSPAYSLFFIAANLIFTTWLCLPFTGLGMKSKKEIQQTINASQKGIQIQELVPVNQIQFISVEDKNELMLLSSYSKKIGHPEKESYPVELSSSADYFNDTALTNFINRQGWMFLSTDTTIDALTDFSDSSISVSQAGPGDIRCTVNRGIYKYLILLQNNYPYWHVSIDKMHVRHFTAFKTFIAIPLPYEKNRVQITFNPQPIKKALWVNVVILLLFGIVLSREKWRNKKLFKEFFLSWLYR